MYKIDFGYKKYNMDILMDVRCKNHYGCANIVCRYIKYNMNVLT